MSSGRGVVGESSAAVRCVRPGCRHSYLDHAPGGGGCMYWFPFNGEHCECHGFRFVPLEDQAPPRFRS
jgi:hypothetical protein